jgi:hypothetical protein
MVRDGAMPVRGRSVVMIWVIVIIVRVDVLQRQRSGDRQQSRRDQYGNTLAHCPESMGSPSFRSNPLQSRQSPSTIDSLCV